MVRKFWQAVFVTILAVGIWLLLPPQITTAIGETVSGLVERAASIWRVAER